MAKRYRVKKKMLRAVRAISYEKLLLYALFFALALGFWLSRALKDNYAVDLKCKLYASELPPDIALSEPLPKVLEFRVRDNGYNILQYKLRAEKMYLFIPLEFSKNRYGSIDIPQELLENMLYSKLLSPQARIDKISPSKLFLQYVPKAKKRLPIALNTAIKPEVGSIIDTIVLSHNSAIVYGGKNLLDTLKAVYTDDRSFEHIKDSSILNVKLVSAKGVSITPTEVSLKIYTRKLIQKVLDVPIVQEEHNSLYRLRLFPSKVKARCFIPEDRLEKLEAEDLLISPDYEQLEKGEEEKVQLKLLKKPEWVKMVEIDPAVVDFILEEK